MATLVDAVGVLQGFGIYDTVLPFLLVTAAMYALFVKFKPFGENKNVNILIAVVIGLVFITTARAVEFVNTLLPLITIFLLMLVIVVLIFTFMGVKGETISGTIVNNPWPIFIFIFIILLVVITTVFPEASVLIQSPETFEQLNLSLTEPGATPREEAAAFLFVNFIRIITSPQVLGLIALFAVLAISVFFITREPKK
jgi:hypothetical protein